MRIETGAVKFGGDWAGVFIRGDSASVYRAIIEAVMDGRLPRLFLKDLSDLLGRCDERKKENQDKIVRYPHLPTL